MIGTMNTADRSIALIDAALRRRFYFVPFFPDEAPVSGVLRRWLAEKKPGMTWVADLVDEANRRLGSRHVAIGPSYFMRENLTEEWLEIIWEHAIMPYLAERFYGAEESLSEYELLKLREVVEKSSHGVVVTEAGAAGEQQCEPYRWLSTFQAGHVCCRQRSGTVCWHSDRR